mmetsp:Transcript_17075/g.20681  ORF Transcript_17075/g.20681 Transcript_17075/m.20681 type:complete len:91 (-) Transcript_17075:311-583(-)
MLSLEESLKMIVLEVVVSRSTTWKQSSVTMEMGHLTCLSLALLYQQPILDCFKESSETFAKGWKAFMINMFPQNWAVKETYLKVDMKKTL